MDADVDNVKGRTLMPYDAENFDYLLGTSGFSDRLLSNHFALYRGYVANLNLLVDRLSAMHKQTGAVGPEYSELKRRFAWEFDGMRLHEYYFGNMARTVQEIDKDSPFYRKLLVDFGSFDNWEREFRATGAIRGVGWVVLYFDRIGNRFTNVWINEHDVGHLAGAAPLLVMDVFEHAYLIDYDLNRAAYIDAFIKAIDWQVVVTRFQ